MGSLQSRNKGQWTIRESMGNRNTLLHVTPAFKLRAHLQHPEIEIPAGELDLETIENLKDDGYVFGAAVLERNVLSIIIVAVGRDLFVSLTRNPSSAR